MHTDRSPGLLDARFVLGAIAGLIVGSLLTMALAVVALDDTEERGMSIALDPNTLGYVDGAWCNEHHRFCILEPAPGEELQAFYTYATHEHFRELGCTVTWAPDQSAPNGDSVGVFTEGCGGAMWDRIGALIFGPAPRDLDRFATEQRDDGILIVDTSKLICDGPGACERAPVRQ